MKHLPNNLGHDPFEPSLPDHFRVSGADPRPKTQADRLAAAGFEAYLTLDDWPRLLSVSRRVVERLKSAGKLPKPDLKIGRMPRWKPETVRAWLAQQAGGRGGSR